MKKSIKRAGAAILVAAAAFSAFVLPKTMAAIAINTDASCAIEINVGKNVGGNYTELSTVPVTIYLYKVASVDEKGDFTADAGYQDLNGDLSALNDATTAEDWAAIAAKTKAFIEAEGEDIGPAMELVTENGSVEVTDLVTGLYLVDAQTTLTDYYQYDFTPYLISLPDNRYYASGSDSWIYELTDENAIGLKPIKADRYGDLVIEKFLDVYNATNAGATFVFQIEGIKTDVDTQEKNVVYSDVVSMTFYEPGKENVVIQNIPAGAEVTVTEIYSGAGYKLTSSDFNTVTIVADEEEGAPVETAFYNTDDGRLNGGTGLVNHFEYNTTTGGWSHSASEDSTIEQ